MDQSYNPYRQTINFFVYLVPSIVKVVSIAPHALPPPDLTQIVAFPHTVAHTVASLKQTLHNYLRKPSMVGQQE